MKRPNKRAPVMVEPEPVEDDDEEEATEREGAAFVDEDTSVDEDSALSHFDDEGSFGDPSDDDVNEGPFAFYSDGF